MDENNLKFVMVEDLRASNRVRERHDRAKIEYSPAFVLVVRNESPDIVRY